jgi:hypothetical protein
MAKVDGPLMSLEARGKIADALVFFPWKGRHAVRHWVKPTNPESTTQGFVRAALYAIGKWISVILSVSGGDALDSKVYSLNTDAAPAGMNWNAFAAKGFLDLLQTGGTFVVASFTDLVDAFSSLATTLLTAFKTEATAIGLADFTFGYGYTTSIEAGCQLYFGALACYYNSIQASAPYNTHPDSWAVADVTNFAMDITATD